MLAAGFYVQVTSADDAFATGDANRRLTEQGIKLGNPSQCVKQSLLAKRVFLVSKGRYRVSQPGRALPAPAARARCAGVSGGCAIDLTRRPRVSSHGSWHRPAPDNAN